MVYEGYCDVSIHSYTLKPVVATTHTHSPLDKWKSSKSSHNVHSSTFTLCAATLKGFCKSNIGYTNCQFTEALQGRKQKQVREVDARSHVDLYNLAVVRVFVFFRPLIYLNMH